MEVVGALTGSRARVRSVEHGDCAVGSSQVTMGHIARVDGVSRDRPARVGGNGIGARTGPNGGEGDGPACAARAGSVEGVILPSVVRT